MPHRLLGSERLHTPLRWFFILIAGAALGCALGPQGRQEVADAVERSMQEQEETGRGYARIPAPATTQPATTQAGPRFQSPASLRDFIVLALQENPEIHAAAETAHAKAERIGQVTALPDPMLSTKTLPEPVRTAEGDNFFILGLQQKFPVPEKLDRAGRIALEEARMAVEQWQETRLGVIADVKRAYFQLYVLDHSIEITRDNQNLLGGLIDVARAQVAAGRRSQDDVLRAQVELSNLQAELINLRQRRVTTAAMLNQSLNRPPATPVPPPADFDLRQIDLSLGELFTKAGEHNPTLEHYQRRIERDREAVELAKLSYWPDFTIGFEWMDMEPRDAFEPPINPQTGMRPVVSQMSEDGGDNWAVTFGFNIPLWLDKIQSGIREAKRNLAASHHQFASARNKIHFEVEDALERVRAQCELAGLFQNTIIPQAEQTYHVSQVSYSAGQSDFLNVIDNWQKWLMFTIQYYRSLGEVERSVADLEQAIGLSLTELGASK